MRGGLTLRRALGLVHLWLGLPLGLYVTLIGLTGALMVVAAPLYQLEYGRAVVGFVQQERPVATPGEWIAKAEAAYGPLQNIEGVYGPGATPMRIAAPTIVYHPPRPDGREVHAVVTVDPYTGAPKGQFVAEESWAMLPLKLHLALMLPRSMGMWLTTIAGVTILLAALTGLALWWPGRAGGRGRLRAALTPAPPRSPAGLRRLHATVGAWVALPLIVASTTGLLLARPDWRPSILAVIGSTQAAETAPVGAPACAATSLDAAAAAALAQIPGGEIARLFFPREPGGPFVAHLKSHPGAPARGDAEVHISPCDAAVTHVRTAADSKPGDVLGDWLVELHSGHALGPFGEAAMFAVGAALAGLPLAGLGLWAWRRRRAGAAYRRPRAVEGV